MITFLSSHQDWNAKVVTEVERLLGEWAPEDEPLSIRLGRISLETWENDTPTLDAILRETTRLAQPHTAMRRNLGPDTHIDGKIVPSGAYVVYPFSDVHLDPEIYPDPWKFDPGRAENKDIPLAYLGWGGGKWFLYALCR
jgi:cytochrome P450